MRGISLTGCSGCQEIIMAYGRSEEDVRSPVKTLSETHTDFPTTRTPFSQHPPITLSTMLYLFRIHDMLKMTIDSIKRSNFRINKTRDTIGLRGFKIGNFPDASDHIRTFLSSAKQIIHQKIFHIHISRTWYRHTRRDAPPEKRLLGKVRKERTLDVRVEK